MQTFSAIMLAGSIFKDIDRKTDQIVDEFIQSKDYNTLRKRMSELQRIENKLMNTVRDLELL